MARRNKQPLETQLVAELEVCQRRIEGHLYKTDKNGNETNEKRNPNSRHDRFIRLLEREANLSAEIAKLRKKRKPRTQKQES